MTTPFPTTIAFPSTFLSTLLKILPNSLTQTHQAIKSWRDSLKRIYNKAKSHLIRFKLRKSQVTSAMAGFSLLSSLNNWTTKVESLFIAKMTSISTKSDLSLLKRSLLKLRSLKKARRALRTVLTARTIPRNNPMKRLKTTELTEEMIEVPTFVWAFELS